MAGQGVRRFVTTGAVVFTLAFSAWMSRAEGHGPKKTPTSAPVQPAAVQPPQPATAPQPLSRPNGSLWSGSSRGWTEDVKAHAVGDTITVVVQETASASSAASTKTSRDDSATFNGGTGFLKPLLNNFGASAKTAVNGQGQTVRTGSLITRLTVTVKEVKPNGNLVIEGVRYVGVNSEKQKVTITGMVRPQDVNPDNTVSSVSVADANIQFDGKGVVGDKQRKGLISTLFGWLFQ